MSYQSTRDTAISINVVWRIFYSKSLRTIFKKNIWQSCTLLSSDIRTAVISNLAITLSRTDKKISEKLKNIIYVNRASSPSKLSYSVVWKKRVLRSRNQYKLKINTSISMKRYWFINIKNTFFPYHGVWQLRSLIFIGLYFSISDIYIFLSLLDKVWYIR